MMYISPVETQNRVNKPLIIIPSVIGAVAGGQYALSNLSAKSISELEKVADFPVVFIKKLKNSFNMKKAEKELKKGKISQEEYNTAKNAYESLNLVMLKQQMLQELSNSDVDKKSDFFKKAVKESQESILSVRKLFDNLKYSQKDKLFELEILNSKKLFEAYNLARENRKFVLKVLFKPISIGILAGTSIGALLGIGLNKLFPKN